MKKQKKKTLLRLINLWGPVIGWISLIFYLSSLTAPPPAGIWFWDIAVPYLAHFIEYFLLFLLLYRALKKPFFSLIIGFFYALSDEFHQAFVPSRTSSFYDVLVDSVGLLIAWLVLERLFFWLPQKARQALDKLGIYNNSIKR